jgi:multiple sugar transport system permease protein
VAEIVTPERRVIAPRRFGRWARPSSETLTAFLFLSPNIFGFLVFTALPVLLALVLSMFDWDLLLGAKFVGLDNFRRLFTLDDVFQASFRNTVVFTVVSVPLSVCIGLGVALLTNQALRGMSFFRAVFLLPFVTVTVALSLVWRWLYLPEIGLINNVLRSIGIQGPAWLTDARWAMWAIIIMSVWRSFGYNMVLFSAGLQAIPVHYYEAATIDGANARQRFRHITLPLLSPTMFFVLIISVINSFQVFDQALIMTAGGPGVATTTLVLHIYNVGFQSFHMGYAASIAWILFIVIFIFTLIQFRAQKRWVTYE